MQHLIGIDIAFKKHTLQYIFSIILHCNSANNSLLYRTTTYLYTIVFLFCSFIFFIDITSTIASNFYSANAALLKINSHKNEALKMQSILLFCDQSTLKINYSNCNLRVGFYILVFLQLSIYFDTNSVLILSNKRDKWG